MRRIKMSEKDAKKSDKKPIFKNWWFWVIIIASIIIIALGTLCVIMLAQRSSTPLAGDPSVTNSDNSSLSDTDSNKTASSDKSKDNIKDNESTTGASSKKCESGDKYPISQNGYYVVGVDIPAGVYAKESDDVSFYTYKDQEQYDSEDYDEYVWLYNKNETVQFRDGNIIGKVSSAGYIVCQ